MNRQEYINLLQQNIQIIFDDYYFNNYKNQIAARKLSADFNATFSENYLWSKAIFLSSNACVLINEGQNKRASTKSLKESAEIFESLSSISENYDREYCIVLAAICYDLAGYQANALCLMRTIPNYSLKTSEPDINLTADNYILFHIQQILLKTISYSKSSIKEIYIDKEQSVLDIGITLFNKAILSWYDCLLIGVKNDYLKEINKVYRYYANENIIHISHLLFLLKTRVKVFGERSIWNNLETADGINRNKLWTKYIKLLTHDVYERNLIKKIENRVSKFEFWTSQLRAIEMKVFDDKKNFIIQMPTSAGKTFIAELVILDSLIKHPGKKCLYIAPFRALSNEKEEELATYISKLGYSVSSLSGSYELDEFQEIILEDTDILIATPEKIDFLFRNNSEYFSSISLIVIDEGHIVGDISARSSLLEFLLVRLKIKIPQLKTLFISAVMPPANADQYSVWLSGFQNNVIRSLIYEDSQIDEEWEPTRKLIGNFSWIGENGRITYRNLATENESTRDSTNAFIPAIIKKRQYFKRYPDGNTKAQTSASLAFELSKNGNCLVFCAQVRDTQRVGVALLNIITEGETNDLEIPTYFKENTETESYFFSQKWFGTTSHVTQCLKRGIGIHYGDMPEAVRRSVEFDYVSGNLKVLISTNTIGQGLNFPIKNLVVHSTIITYGRKVSVRDFWNIIGRAGRAGKETEGQIVFVINSYTDGVSYNEYTNKSNIEAAFSMFFNILKALLETRISQELYERYIEILCESYLLNVLSEEAVDTDTEKIIEQIVNNSLFKVQAESSGIDIQPIKDSFTKIIKNIREVVPAELAIVFGQTGFLLASNQAIVECIDKNEENLRSIIDQDNYLGLLQIILALFDEEKIDEVKSEKLTNIEIFPSDLFNIAKLWIEINEIDIIQREAGVISINNGQLNIIISDAFYYRYAWAITAFITILISKFTIEKISLPEGIKNLASYLKFGVNNPTACLARSLGIKNRDVAALLAKKSSGLTGRDFIRWVANLTLGEINSFDLNIYDRINVITTVNKLMPQKFDGLPNSFEFYIKGIIFEEVRIITSRFITIGDKLEYSRENANEFDAYAIKLFRFGNELGYVPREYSRVISVEIDINDTFYEVEVLNIIEEETHNSIFVRMTKVNL